MAETMRQPSAPASPYVELCEALRRRKVLAYYGAESGQQREMEMFEYPRMAVPAFDFGYLLTGNHPDNIIDRVPLPIPEPAEVIEAAYLMTFVENGQDVVWVSVGNREDDGRVTFSVFAYLNEEQWFLMNPHDPQMESLFWRIEGAQWLLENPAIIEKEARPNDVEAANRRRRISGLPPLPPVSVIRLHRNASKEAQGGTHASPRPHNRRGYTYMRRGKLVTVRPCRVRGGVDKPALYVIKP